MFNRRRFVTTAATLVAAAAMAACTAGSADNKNAHVRYLNLLGDGTAIGVTLSGAAVASGVSYEHVSAYHETGSNNYTATVTNGAGATIATWEQALGQLHYTVYVYGTAADVKHLNINDELPILSDKQFTTRLLVASDTLTGYDLYITAADADLATTSPNAIAPSPASLSGFSTVLEPGTYRVRITPTGTKTVVYDGTMAFAAKASPTFVMYAAAGQTTPRVMRTSPAEGDVTVLAPAP